MASTTSYTTTPWTPLEMDKKWCRMDDPGLPSDVVYGRNWICLYPDDRRRVWRQPGNIERLQHSVPHVRQGDVWVMFWGGTTWAHSTPLVVVESNLTSLRYRNEILKPIVGPYRQHFGDNFISRDDNSRVRRSVLVNTFLQHARLTGMEWPACSPDINLIEHVWHQLKQAVFGSRLRPRTLRDLRRITIEE